MSKKKITANELSKSLTGFDEIAIKQKFGVSLNALIQYDQTQFLRALVFVLRRRDGKLDAEAFHIAQSLGLGDVQAEFGDEDAEADFEEQPTTTTP